MSRVRRLVLPRKHDLLCNSLAGYLLSAPSIPQGDGHCALGAGLSDDVAVELGDDLTRCHGVHLKVTPPRSLSGSTP